MDVHAGYMARAIELAHEAAACGEVPVGAVVVTEDGQIIGEGHNRSIVDCDPSAHAEIVAIRAAARNLGNYRLESCILYVTLEPCPMCLGAIFHSRIRSVYFGATDPKSGACGSVVSLDKQRQLNPHCTVHGGVRAEQCANDLRRYFSDLREKKKKGQIHLREDALRLPESALAGLLPGAKSVYPIDLPEAQGLRVHVWSKGASLELADSLVLCIHSFGHWAWQFLDLFSSTIPLNTILLSIDLPGHGLSDRSKTGWEFETPYQVSVLHALMTKFRSKQLTLVAHGSGAALAMALAQMKFCSVIRQIILVDPVSSHQASIADSKEILPRSWVRMSKQLSLISLQSDVARGVSAPYPDSGYSRGLLRWLATAHQTAPTHASQVGEERALQAIPIVAFRHADALASHMHEFFSHWGVQAEFGGDWASVRSQFWTAVHLRSINIPS